MSENGKSVGPGLMVGLGIGVTGYFIYEGDRVAAIALTIVLLSALFGHWIKGSRLIGLTCGLVAAVALAPPLIESCEQTFADWFGTSGLINQILSTSVIGGLILLAVAKILHFFLIRHLLDRASPDTFNRRIGFVIGACEGVILCMFLIGGVMNLEPRAKQRLMSGSNASDNLVVRRLCGHVVEYAAMTRASAVGRLIADFEFFEEFALLEPLRDKLRLPEAEAELAIDETPASG